MDQPAQIQEKAPKPQGLLPKNVQSWLLAGLAVLMVSIMWLTGGKKQQSATKRTTPVAASEAPLEVNETKIAELQSRIQELQREQLVAQSALAQQGRLLTPSPSEPGAQSVNPSPDAPGERAEDTIRAEQKKRDYLSRFASNVAL